jgi:hypothetical protein
MRLGSFVLMATVSMGLAAASADVPRGQFAQAFGQRCQTQQGWCIMSAPAPAGSQCFCPSPNGPVAGQVVR